MKFSINEMNEERRKIDKAFLFFCEFEFEFSL